VLIGPIEPFDEGILVRLARLNIPKRDPAVGQELRPVIQSNRLGLATPGRYLLRHPNHPFSYNDVSTSMDRLPAHLHPECCTSEIVICHTRRNFLLARKSVSRCRPAMEQARGHEPRKAPVTRKLLYFIPPFEFPFDLVIKQPPNVVAGGWYSLRCGGERVAISLAARERWRHY